MGLVNLVFPTDDLAEATYRLAEDIASLAPLSHRANKETLKQVMSKPSLDNLTPDEAGIPLIQFDTKDYHEGYRAFLEKRRPQFAGE